MSHLVVSKVECVEIEGNYGRFVAEPLEKGFGITLGNAMRRVMLSQLQGAAVTRVKIEGIQHEFSPIPHVKEDVIDFLLNVKALRLRPLTERPGKLTLEVEGERQVSAADIEPSADFEVANPELYLATLDSSEARLYVEFDVELSNGYREAQAVDNMPIGVIPVDSIFSPIRKVNFTVEPIYIGQQTSRERLFLEVWTDGTLSPEEAVRQGAGILVAQMSPFADYAQQHQVEAEEEAGGGPVIPEELYNMSVEQLNLSTRTLNCLRRGGITTVGELASKTEKELAALRNFGQKSAEEIKNRLVLLGISSAPTQEEELEEEEKAASSSQTSE